MTEKDRQRAIEVYDQWQKCHAGKLPVDEAFLAGYATAMRDKELEMMEATSASSEQAACYSNQCDELWEDLKEERARSAKLLEALYFIANEPDSLSRRLILAARYKGEYEASK
jgi:dihydroorotase-like cyclic amidohydrolase